MALTDNEAAIIAHSAVKQITLEEVNALDILGAKSEVNKATWTILHLKDKKHFSYQAQKDTTISSAEEC